MRRPLAVLIVATARGLVDEPVITVDAPIGTPPEDGRVLSEPNPSPTPAPQAGDDPTFIGADGVPYEVRGEPWKYFNLLSTPSISLNAQFLPVPPGFVHGNITDTVLGTLHLAACAPDVPNRTAGLLLDISSGERYCTLTPPAGGAAVPTPCAEAMSAVGVTLGEEVAGCALSTMKCSYLAKSELPALRAHPALVQVHMARLNLTHAGASLSVERDVVDRPAPPELRDADCTELAAYERARRACEVARAVHRGEAPLADWRTLPGADRVALLARMTGGDAAAGQRDGRQFFFHNLRIDGLPPQLAQADVHGLLGQRAVHPAPMAAEVADAASDSALAELAALAMSGAMEGREGPSSGSTTLQAAVAADGHVQGEGAIVGSYLDYQVAQVSSHAFAHSRFACAPPHPPLVESAGA